MEFDHALSVLFVSSSAGHFLKDRQVVLLWETCWKCISSQYTVSSDAELNVDGELLLTACQKNSIRILFY
jgi:hypothetical protein